jgi:hypothetical protein
MEHGRIGMMALLVGLASLATDVSRLALELAPQPFLIGLLKSPRPAQQESEPNPDPPPERPILEPPATPPSRAPPQARPRGPPQYEAGRQPFSRLPPDFSTSHAPWCMACRQQTRRQIERGIAMTGGSSHAIHR